MRCLKDRPPVSDLFGVKGHRWLAEQELAVCERETVDAGLRQVDFLDTEIAQVDQLIAADALGWPEVKAADERSRRQRHRRGGVHGRRRRHPPLRRPAQADGLSRPGPARPSVGRRPANHGHISKQGSNSARHALVEACWSTVRQPGPIAAFYARIKAKRGHSITIVASARKLACLFWCLLTAARTTRLPSPR